MSKMKNCIVSILLASTLLQAAPVPLPRKETTSVQGKWLMDLGPYPYDLVLNSDGTSVTHDRLTNVTHVGTYTYNSKIGVLLIRDRQIDTDPTRPYSDWKIKFDKGLSGTAYYDGIRVKVLLKNYEDK